MIEVMTAEQAPRQVKDLFNKGFTALERGNLDYAVDLLSSCVQMAPGFLQARKFLRAAEIKRQKTRKQDTELYHGLSLLGSLPAYLVALGRVKSNPDATLMAAEKLLRKDAISLPFIKLFAQAASNAELPDAAIQTLEMAREHHPENILIINWLGSLYLKVGRTRSARECFEKLCQISPNDASAVKALKDAMAIDSMRSDGWQEAADKGGSFRDMIRNEDQAVLLERDQKAIKSDKDVDSLIASMQQKIETEPGNMNYYRQLGRLFAQKQDYASALATLHKARQMSPGDAELDQAITAVRVQEFDAQIVKLRESGQVPAAEAKRREREQFLFDDMQERVKRYPNDLGLKHQLGVMLFDNDYIDDAIQQFQLAQRNPRNRTSSLTYLARCFKAKKQYDMAAEQYEKALSELVGMDMVKKGVLYELGEVYELMGQFERAREFYKQVYQVDIGFRDVARKVEQTSRSESAS